MENKTRKNVQAISLTGLMAALIVVMTAFVKVPTGINTGYIHLGDSMVYLAGCLIAGPAGALAGAIGGALADVLAGAPQWAIASAIIKAINAVPFIIIASRYKKQNGKIKIITPLTIAMTIVSGIITVGGYFIAEGIMYSFTAAIPSIPFNIIQAVGSAIAFVLIGLALDAVKINKLIK